MAQTTRTTPISLKKCPRCELNYITDGEKYCTVCRREIKGEPERESFEICSVCNENPVLPGKDMCIFCLKELGRTEPVVDEEIGVESSDMDVESVATMDEIAMDMEESEIPRSELGEIDRELSLEEAIEEESSGGDDDENEEE
ncbi:hypothetical protein FACS1894184_12210 [Clostridia bacterium]|nr:hypothetical protein FACS1894184_12210 [Clostridia bacterium]